MYEDQIARGVMELDERVSGWRGYVDTGTLNMKSFVSCVLGQIGNATGHYDYHGTMEHLEWTDNDGVVMGFTLPWVERGDQHLWDTLTREWRAVLDAIPVPEATP
jgi:hypothetical protein